MTIIADRGMFVRLLVQSGKFAAPDAEALADALDATIREPATRADLTEMRSELKADLAEVKAELKAELAEVKAELKSEIADVRKDLALLSQRMEALGDKLTVRLGGIGLAIAGLLFAALRLT